MISKSFVQMGVLGMVVLSCGTLMADSGTYTSQTGDILNQSLNSIDESYRGQHQYFNDDVVGNLISNICAALVENVINPFINGVKAGDPKCLVGAVILVVIAVGFFHRMGGRLFDSVAGPQKASGSDVKSKS